MSNSITQQEQDKALESINEQEKTINFWDFQSKR